MESALERETSPSRAAGMLLWPLSFMLVFAPLFRAGQPPIPLLIMQITAVGVLFVTLWKPAPDTFTSREVIVIVLLLLFPILWIVPLPGLHLEWLPGREQYADTLRLIGEAHIGQAATLSLYPLETQSAWLTLLVPVAVFLGSRTLDHRNKQRLALLLIAIAAAQAALGLMQFSRGPDSPLYFGMTYTHFGSGVGTYTNRNHLAGLIEMVLPITLALFLYSLGRREVRSSRDWRGRIAFMSTFRGHATFAYGALALLLIVGMIFTRSRTGIALTILGIILVTLAFSRRIGGDNVYGPAGTVATFAVAIGIAIGLAPVLDRFSSLDPLEDTRWTIFSATMNGIGTFFPVGSGPGTYPEIFRAFQPIELGHSFINHAHNDYLEWLFEGGAFAGALIVMMLGLYFIQWGKVWTKERWSRFRFLQVGAGIGMFLLLLHELVDYNLYIPANMVYFAFLAGIFFSDPNQEVATTSAKRRKRRRTRRLEGVTVEGTSTVKPYEPSPDQIKNPFLD